MKKIISILLILALFLSFIPLHSSLSGEVTPPEGFKFSNEYQRIPVTLDKATYYAYQIEKNDGKQKVTGWLIVDSNNKTVSDQSAYTKLALAATVTKYIEENPTISTIMKSDLDMLHNLKWKMALYEVSQALIKTVSSGIGAMATGKPPTGAFEEVVSMASFVPQAAAIELSDKYLDEFTHWTANTFYETLIKTGEIKGDLSSGANIFKFCGVLQSIIRKGALISTKKGIDSYNESYGIFKNHTGPWSYQDAQKFLEGYTKGKARAVAYGSWYLRLIPHNSNMWFNIGSTVWDNVVKQVLPAKIEDITNAADAVTKFVPLFIKIVKESPDKLIYNQVEEDIKNMSSLLNILRLLYNTSIKDSPANIIFNAITESLRGTLSVTSNPKGAKIYVNGEYEGITPIDITLTPGKYSVKITKEGYKDYYSSVTVSQKETTKLPVTLKFLTNEGEESTGALVSYYYKEWNDEITLNKDGTIDVIENLSIYFGSHDGGQAYHWFKRWIDLNRIKNITDVQVFENVNGVLVPYKKGDSVPGTFIVYREGNSVYIKLNYEAKNVTKCFILKYKVLGATDLGTVSFYEKNTSFNYIAIPSKNEVAIDKAIVTVHIPKGASREEIKAWGAGLPIGSGNVTIVNGNKVILTGNHIIPGQFIEFNIVFPRGLVIEPEGIPIYPGSAANKP